MSQLDMAKETIAYLKFWLGVMVVSDISLVGWLLSSSGANAGVMFFGAVAGVIAITFFAFFVHKRVEHLISTLKEL